MTRFLALIAIVVSSYALLSLVYLLKPMDWMLPMPWFSLNLVAQLLCLLVFQHHGNWPIHPCCQPCFLISFYFVRFTNWSPRWCQLAGNCSWLALPNYFFSNQGTVGKTMGPKYKFEFEGSMYLNKNLKTHLINFGARGLIGIFWLYDFVLLNQLNHTAKTFWTVLDRFGPFPDLLRTSETSNFIAR